MISVYRDEVKDALFRRSSKCTKKNNVITTRAPENWTASRVKNLRKSLYLAQSVFADVLGVSLATVVSWENSQNVPCPMAARLMEILEACPDVLLEAGIVDIN